MNFELIFNKVSSFRNEPNQINNNQTINKLSIHTIYTYAYIILYNIYIK